MFQEQIIVFANGIDDLPMMHPLFLLIVTKSGVIVNLRFGHAQNRREKVVDLREG